MTRLDSVLRSRVSHPSARAHIPVVHHQEPSRARPNTSRHIMSFRIEVEQSPAVQLLRLHGEVDAAGAEILAEVLACEHEIAARRGAVLRLDLGAVTYMDRAGLSALLEAKRAIETVGQAFTMDIPGEVDLDLLERSDAVEPLLISA